MWRELIEELFPDAKLGAPAADGAVAGAAEQLGQPIPDPLAALLAEVDGVTGTYHDGIVWDLDRIVSANLESRSDTSFAELYMPFEPLLFVADAGNGSQFALLNPPVDRRDVFLWDHETDSRTWAAANLRDYLRRRAAGEFDD